MRRFGFCSFCKLVYWLTTIGRPLLFSELTTKQKGEYHDNCLTTWVGKYDVTFDGRCTGQFQLDLIKPQRDVSGLGTLFIIRYIKHIHTRQIQLYTYYVRLWAPLWSLPSSYGRKLIGLSPNLQARWKMINTFTYMSLKKIAGRYL